ncbi:MAG TPA: alpha-2-macroglobulin family protein, partial [Chthoniobacteraceae bacterium]|nr:alpha-2-macroglobulin family protein [Chthoniobacteraceae bacterium]
PIPPEKLAAVAARVKEFTQNATDPYSGQTITDPDTDIPVQHKTELLMDVFGLQSTGSGEFDATDGDKQVLREIEWQPAGGKKLSGAYLLEVSGAGADGRVVGNRTIVSFSDVILTEKRTDSAVTVRVAKMSDGMPAPGITVHVVTRSNKELDRATTDENGIVSFSEQLFAGYLNGNFLGDSTPADTNKDLAYTLIADTQDGPALQFLDLATFNSGAPIYTPRGANANKQGQELRSVIVTDRNLYRPLQTVEMKGMLRVAENGALTIPAGAQAHWRITGADDDHTVIEGDAPISADGGWTAHWDIPEKIQLTDYSIHCQYGDLKAEATANFGIQEYRVPLFSAEVSILNKTGSSSQAKVTSAYFHGAPNRGARVHWTATWTSADGVDSDRYSDDSTADADGDNDEAKFTRYDSDTGRDDAVKPKRDPEDSKTVEGDATLDANGVATIKCDSPFTDGVVRGRCTVVWKADITSIDGQTITGGDSVTLQLIPALPGIRVTEQTGEQPDQHGVKVEVDAVDADDKPAAGLQMDVDLYHLTTKSVKEKLGPFVYCYRNTTTYTKVATHTFTAPGAFVFPVDDTGDYNAVATTKNQDHTPIVSANTNVTGDEPAEFPVENEATFKITHEDKKFQPGENAVLHVEAPFAGVAWVSVESNEILTTKLVKLDGNSGRIELPVKKEYGPNVFVSVYLVKPGGAGELPKERFAFTDLKVNVPEQELNIATTTEKDTVRPGDPVRGEITVLSESKPVQNADIAVFAVDDAVLKLGEWKLPDAAATFYPERRFGVSTYSALARYITGIKRDSITEKGFVIGDGGDNAFKNVTVVRKEFRTLAYWESSLKTDAQGKIKFEFKAPDNLTSYRIVAVGETDKNQFGGDASCVVKISKTLIAEPALPRFVRNGDELELRLVVREKCANTDQVVVRCVPDEHLQIIGSAEATQEATNDVPVVYRFRAKVVDPDFTPANIRFDAASKTNSEATDSVQNTLPCFPPVTVRVDTRAGTFDGPNFDPAQKMPDTWKNAHGVYDLTISTSQYLPKINGLPVILDYPHGCFDQISTRMLGYGALGDLLAYLPNAESREKNYRDSIQNGLKQFGDAVHQDGMLPYWPEEEKPSPFCTAEACWALGEIENGGFKIPEKLPEKIAKATKEIALGHVKSEPFTQALALTVLSQKHADADFATVVQDLYLKRNNSDDETRALLALTMHQLNIMPKEKAQLMREIDNGDILAKAFDPATFSSATRAEAVRALAFCKIAPENWTPEKKDLLRKKMLALMDSSTDLSTQENLWLLLAFKAFQDSENIPKLELPKDTKAALSSNGDSAGWRGLAIPPGVNKALSGLNGAQLSYVISGKYMSDNPVVDREDHGIRVERVVRNLTDPKRTGTAEAPFKLGDQILISYRMFTQKPQDYVALEDELPAGLETMNFNLPQVGKFYPDAFIESKEPALYLSHSELRDQASMLYFDQLPSGASVYGILARATVAGTFRWPATQVEPMYDSRFSGLSPSSLCVVASGD